MTIEIVHQTQEVFRMILHCMSRPGTIENIRDIEKTINAHGDCPQSIFVTAITLLDAEVSFCVIGEHAREIEESLSSFTFAKVADVEEADYIFVMKDTPKKLMRHVLKFAKKGTFENPDRSATILVETEKLSNEPSLTLRGPGIQDTVMVEIAESTFWLTAREEANHEFPLGIDMILIDEESNLMCLPRTTTIQNSEVHEWHM